MHAVFFGCVCVCSLVRRGGDFVFAVPPTAPPTPKLKSGDGEQFTHHVRAVIRTMPLGINECHCPVFCVSLHVLAQ